MREYRVQARQAHPVPDQVTAPRGPFPPELYAHQEIVTDYIPEGDDYLPGATAQNDYQPPRILTCRVCLAEVPEPETPFHTCPEEEETP